MQKVKLRNYTTSVPASKSIGEIQALLIKFGSEKVMIESKGGRIDGISFAIRIDDDLTPFKLPANTEKVLKYLWEEYCDKTTRRRKEQSDFIEDAYNIAWRIIKDWIHAQLSIIEIGMVHAEEVFLPYLILDGNKTLYQKFASGEMKKFLPLTKFEE